MEVSSPPQNGHGLVFVDELDDLSDIDTSDQNLLPGQDCTGNVSDASTCRNNVFGDISVWNGDEFSLGANIHRNSEVTSAELPSDIFAYENPVKSNDSMPQNHLRGFNGEPTNSQVEFRQDANDVYTPFYGEMSAVEGGSGIDQNVIQPILIAPEPGYESWNPFNTSSCSNPTDPADNLKLCLSNEVPSKDVLPLVIEPMSDDSDDEDQTTRVETSVSPRGPSRKLLRCVKCRRKFASPGQLLRHKKLYCTKKRPRDCIVKLPQFTCLKCNFRSNGRVSLTSCILHTKIHDKLKYGCQDCDVKFKWWNSVLRHWKDYHKPVDEEQLVAKHPTDEEEDYGECRVDLIPRDHKNASTCAVNTKNVLYSSILATTDSLMENDSLNGKNYDASYLCGNCYRTFTMVHLFCVHAAKCLLTCRCGVKCDTMKHCSEHRKDCSYGASENIWFWNGSKEVTPFEIPCPQCSFVADDDKKLIYHLEKESWHEGIIIPSSPYTKRFAFMCPICLKYIYHSRNMPQVVEKVMNHLKMCHRHTQYISSYKCQFCDTTIHPRDITRHNSEKHQGKPTSSCLSCGRIFIRIEPLVKHVANHNLCTFRCKKCLWAFDGLDGLRNHLFSHHNQKFSLYKCKHSEGSCDFSAQYHGHLSEHHRKHLWFKWKCDQCPERFYTADLLGKHVIQHAAVDLSQMEDDWFNCQTRSQFPPRTNGFVRGQVAGSSSCHAACFMCELTFKSICALVQHVKLVHKNCIVFRCDPRTTVVSFRVGEKLRLLCLGCRICSAQNLPEQNHFFQSMNSFEEHCDTFSDIHSAMFPGVIDQIPCIIPYCAFLAKGEVQFYRHLAIRHKNMVVIRVSNEYTSLSIEHLHNDKLKIYHRYSCKICKMLFFSRPRLIVHLSRCTMNDKEEKDEVLQLLCTQDVLPSDVLVELRRSGMIAECSPWHTSAIISDRRSTISVDQVLISANNTSSGSMSLIVHNGHHITESVDECDSCYECEKQLQVKLPVGLCLANRQPLVTLHGDDVRKYMVNYVLKSGRSIPQWYHQYAINIYKSEGSSSWKQVVQTLKPSLPIKSRRWKMLQIKKEKKKSTLIGSQTWDRFCRKCHQLYQVFVLQADCVHRRFIIVSLVNPEKNSEDAENKTEPEPVPETYENNDAVIVI